MSDGKKEVWKLSQPLKADPVFHALGAVHTNDLLPTPSNRPELKALPLEFISLYGLDATSTATIILITLLQLAWHRFWILITQSQ
jgi:hypothetical protein